MAGTLNIALAQQFDINGQPLAGAQLYLFAVGTVATPQNSFSDPGLTLQQTWPLVADQYGRIPMFYLADGYVHVRLTDALGVVIFDYPSMLVVGPSSGGGGGGGGSSVDPTTIMSTGDFKWRPTSETLAGWVKANGQTIGNATSGASQRANADTQNLFSYLWQNFTNAHCPVVGGRGASAAADFTAGKTIQLPDLRDLSIIGLDDMGNTAKGGLLASNITSGGGDGVTTPAATGGESNHTLVKGEIPTGLHNITDPSHSHSTTIQQGTGTGGGSGAIPSINPNFPVYFTSTTATTGITLTDNAGGGAHNNMSPFMLGTFYIKL